MNSQVSRRQQRQKRSFCNFSVNTSIHSISQATQNLFHVIHTKFMLNKCVRDKNNAQIQLCNLTLVTRPTCQTPFEHCDNTFKLKIIHGYVFFHSGVFSPPISGTYLLTIHTRNNGENGYIQIKSDDALLCEAFVTDTVNGANMASCTVVAPLSTSNSVRVTGETSNPADILEAGFSGHLIEADSFGNNFSFRMKCKIDTFKIVSLLWWLLVLLKK